jgi:hypothetical protein
MRRVEGKSRNVLGRQRFQEALARPRAHKAAHGFVDEGRGWKAHRATPGRSGSAPVSIIFMNRAVFSRCMSLMYVCCSSGVC